MATPNILTTIHALPSAHLPTAYLVGKSPFLASTLDPRVSFSLYVPAGAYSRAHDHLRSGGAPSTTPRLPVIISLHGARRDASQSRDSLVAFAEAHGVAILAPLFPAGLDAPFELDNYKHLRSPSLHADRVLLAILDQAAAIWPGCRFEKVTLVGWSGGAQFAHRFAYFHAARLEALVVASPGGTTQIGDERLWPKGLRVDVKEDSRLEGLEVDLEALRAVRYVFMTVGAEDGLPKGSAELKKAIAELGAKTGLAAPPPLPTKPRYEGLRELHENWRANGIGQVGFELVPGVAHTYLEVLPTIVRWLEKCPVVVGEKAS